MPTLYSIAGPLKGTTIELTESEITIGRDRSSNLPIADLNLSRKHCMIQKEGNEFKIIDLDSRNGIYVNSIPVRERILHHGDQIEAGSSIFVFLSEEADKDTFAEGHVSTGALLTTKWNESVDEVRDLKQADILLKFSSALSFARDLPSLGQKLLDLLLEVIPAQRGAVLIMDHSTDTLMPISSFSKVSVLPVRVSRSMIDQAIKEKSALLATDVQQESVSISSLIAAPIVYFECVLGILYVDTANTGKHLHSNDLQLINAISSISASAIQNRLDVEQWIEKNRQLQKELRMDRQIIGESAAMKSVFDLIRKISGTDTTVLICGESGTGKELAARAIHANSRCSEGAFIAINCAALPDSLLESELFGYEKGAFTGAVAQKKGKLEIAADGTLFLDEVAELAPTLQAKLLRVLQEREFERVGGTRTIQVDIRLLAATNRDLAKEVVEGRFRQDLYYRLNVVKLEMPPLRNLDDDILLLANYFVSRFRLKLGRRIHGISPEAQQCLKDYDWPGNVREMENALERAVLLGSTDLILPEDLPETLLSARKSGSAPSTNFHEAVNEYKKKLIRRALEAAGNNYTVAATNLGIHYTHLYRLVRNLKLDRE